MNGSAFSRNIPAALAVLAIGGALLAGCGSDDSSSGAEDTGNASGYASKPAETKQSGSQTEVTPGKKKPASAGDKKKNAPDDAISGRPGGPDDQQAAPTSP